MSLEPLAGIRVLDLFAGSGALGIEALSRGALRVDFVEHDRSARAALVENLKALGLENRSRVWPLELPAGLARLAAEVADADLVLADPPYGGGPARAVLATLGAMTALREGARVIVEHHGKDELPESSGRLERTRQRRYGETVVTSYHVAAAESLRETGKDRA